MNVTNDANAHKIKITLNKSQSALEKNTSQHRGSVQYKVKLWKRSWNFAADDWIFSVTKWFDNLPMQQFIGQKEKY